MSLEQALAENTAAVRELIAALNGRTSQAAPVKGAPEAPKPAPAAEAPAASPAPSAGPAPAVADTPVTRDSAKVIAKELNVKDSKKLKDVLTTLGAANFAAVPDDKLVEFVKLAKEALA